jgi:hypothetical protein
MEALILSLLHWIGAHSEYETARLPAPPVVLLSPAALTARVHGKHGNATEGDVDPRILGFFSLAAETMGTIYLIRPEETPGADQYADPTENPIFRERLLHELVHYAQHASGDMARFRCPSQGELAAYRLGGNYLRELHVPDPLRHRDWLARAVVQC